MKPHFKGLIIITLTALLITFLIWLPHILSVPEFYNLNFSRGFSTIYQNYDGLEYVIIAKSFYDPNIITQLPQPKPPAYYPSHFPGFPIFIATLAPLLGYLKSMLFISIAFTILASFAFYLLVSEFKLTSQPLWLSIMFLVIPARWIVVHSIGSPEPIFIFFTIMAIYFFKKFDDSVKFKYILPAAVFASLAQLTRPPGILLFTSFGLYLLYKVLKTKNIKQNLSLVINSLPLIMVPLTLVGIFFLFQWKLGDFWAYFHTGDNIHLSFPPFQVFNKDQFWVGDIWLEDIVYIFILGLLAGLMLLKTRLSMAGFYIITYLAAASLIAHRDIARYVMPIYPFALIAFERVLISREFKIVIAIIALALYLYSQNFLLQNVAPVAVMGAYN